MSSDPYTDFYSEVLNDPLFNRFIDTTDLNGLCEELEFNNDMETKQCPITLNNFREKEKIIKLPCNHIFSKDAIKEWFSNKTTCPFCRYDLINVQSDISNQSIGEQIESIIEHLSNQLLNNNVEENVHFEIY